MKLSDLFEMSPYWAKGEKDPAHWKKTLEVCYSENAIEREYQQLTSFELDNEVQGIKQLSIFFHKETLTVIACFKTKNQFNENCFKPVFELNFRSKTTIKNFPADLKNKKILQVTRVQTGKSFQNLGIASFIYQYFIKHDFVILSDTSQFDGGKVLWDKLIRRSELSEYKIRILDDERGYLKHDGKVIEYNGHNIGEDEIWTTNLNFDWEHKFLILSK